jgi:hypothetical protein
MDRRYRHVIVAVLALCLQAPPAATAAGGDKDVEAVPGAASAYAVPVEGFMTLSGRILVGADHRVSGFAIDRAGEVPDEVKAFLARQAAEWRVEFDPGLETPTEPVRFTTRVRASPAGDGVYRMWLDGINVEETLPVSQRLVATRMRRPEYPRGMARIGASGVVYVLALVGRDGRVDDVFAEQVDLTAMPEDPADVAQLQLEFMAGALGAVRQWRFRPIASGPFAGGAMAVRIPVVFVMHGRVSPYGQWEYLVRGVRKRAPWGGGGADHGAAIAAAGIQPARSRIRVVTQADGHGG